jgi:hypothetical protein
MPGALTGIGYGVFAGVKLLGYMAAAKALKWGYPESRHGTIKVGAARTAIGMAAGLAYGAVWIWVLEKALMPGVNEIAMLSIYYFALLLPLRVAEWGLTIWLFFDRGLQDKGKLMRWIGWGILCSYLLDVMGLVSAFVVPGGFWIC